MRLPLAVLATLLLAAPAAAHPLGGCLPAGGERCERWSAIFSTPAPEGTRSDQFPQAVDVSSATAFVAARDVAFAPQDPYDGTRGRGAVVAYDLVTGAERWRAAAATRPYDTVNDVAVAPDGATVFATGAAYDAWSIAATDARMVTTALDATTGAVRWQTTWDARPDARDIAKVVAVAPDGRRLYVGGVTTEAGGALDYVVAAYDTATGRERWVRTYSGLGTGGNDVLYGLAVSPDGDRVVATGDSAGTAQFDTDVTTVAYDAKRGKVGWVQRLDGAGAQVSDRVNALAVDDRHAYVTGDGSPGPGGGSIDVQTAALDLATGELAWNVRTDPSGGRFDTGRAIAVSGDRVVTVAQSPSPVNDEGLDLVTTAHDVATGEVAWTARRAAARTSELANDVAAGDGLAIAIGSARPVVQYTALDEQVLEAYDLATGGPRWSTRLDAGTGNALTGHRLALSPDGASVTTIGQRTLSANPLGPETQDVYDTVTATFPAR